MTGRVHRGPRRIGRLGVISDEEPETQEPETQEPETQEPETQERETSVAGAKTRGDAGETDR